MTLNINGDFLEQQEPDNFVMEMLRDYSAVGTYVVYKKSKVNLPCLCHYMIQNDIG